jgi:hypothetical protein
VADAESSEELPQTTNSASNWAKNVIFKRNLKLNIGDSLINMYVKF